MRVGKSLRPSTRRQVQGVRVHPARMAAVSDGQRSFSRRFLMQLRHTMKIAVRSWELCRRLLNAIVSRR